MQSETTKKLQPSDLKTIQQIITFWFGDSNHADFGMPKPFWFASTPQDDQLIRQRFETHYKEAFDGKYDHWKNDPQGSLALVLLLDQMPRNMFRRTAKAFLTDTLALAISKAAIDQKQDQTLPPVLRRFLYMPFMHAEDLQVQEESLKLFKSLNDQNTLDYAKKHHAIIQQFGRFPQRNIALGRLSQPEEIDFLNTWDRSF